MTLEIALPFGKKNSVKDIVFTILTKEYPLRIIDLMNHIRKRYGKSVTFQAVRKSVLQLIEEGVLMQKESKFLIKKEWVLESKKILDELHRELIKEKITPNKVDSIRGEISVFTFNSLNEMMKFWQDIIKNWFENFKKGDSNLNYYQAAHVWEGLMHPDIEMNVMNKLKKKGIKSYTITTGGTPLDKQIAKFYSKLGIKVHISPSTSTFEKSYYVATYGDMIVQTQYPEKTVKRLDSFFKKNKSLKDLDLVELSNIINSKIEVKLTVIKNLSMAKQINKSIISLIE